MSDPIRTADLCDAHPGRVRVLAPGLRAYGGRALFHGPAVTLRTRDDNSKVREAVSQPGEGHVLVVDNAGSMACALLGGDLAAKAAENGWAGLIIAGAVRDAHELEETDIGVLALASVPRKSEKRGIGTLDVPVRLCGVTVQPGAWIYADRDGVVLADGPVHEN